MTRWIRPRPLQFFLVSALFIFFSSNPTLAATDTDSLGADGSAILTWEPPTTKVNGQQLTDLEGYKIYYGVTPDIYSWVIDVGDVNTYEVIELDEDVTYYFAITAYNVFGESQASPQVSKFIEPVDVVDPSVEPDAVPGVAILLSPNTAISGVSPTFKWIPAEGAEIYSISVKGPDGTWVLGESFYASDTGCGNGEARCSLTFPDIYIELSDVPLTFPDVFFTDGDYEWWIVAENSFGAGSHSEGMAFSVYSETVVDEPVVDEVVVTEPPGQTTLISPNGEVTHTPTYTWSAVDGATTYSLSVQSSSGAWVVNESFYSSDVGCDNGEATCSATVNITLGADDYTWWAVAKNDYGAGMHSKPMQFTVSVQ